MRLQDLAVAAGQVGGPLGQAVAGLVKVAVAAKAGPCASCPYSHGAGDACLDADLERALRDLEAVVGPIPAAAEAAP